MTTVDLSDLQDSVDWVSATLVDNRAFICRRTGKIYWLSDEYGLEDADIESAGDLDDLDKYLQVPNKYELDIGNRLVFDFVAANLPNQYDRVRDIFRRKGAYGAFKNLLAKSNSLDAWYEYSERRTRQAIREWCESKNIEVAEDSR